jgi:hypothetical protein
MTPTFLVAMVVLFVPPPKDTAGAALEAEVVAEAVVADEVETA